MVDFRFKLALKYLSIGIDRILHINECVDILPGLVFMEKTGKMGFLKFIYLQNRPW